jgi:hypothetical protein
MGAFPLAGARVWIGASSDPRMGPSRGSDWHSMPSQRRAAEKLAEVG